MRAVTLATVAIRRALGPGVRAAFSWCLHDLHTAARSLRRAPAHAGAATAILAVGFAATATLTAIADGVLLRPLPLADADALVVVWKRIPDGFDRYPFLRDELDVVARESRQLAAVAGISRDSPHVWTMRRGETVEEVTGALVTGAYFDVVGASAVRGRPLIVRDDLDGAAPVLVLSHGFWHRAFGGRDDVIGEVITVSEQRFTIVGVMSPGVEYPHDIDVWRPLATVSESAQFGQYLRRNVDMIARLSPGASRDQATAELGALLRRLEADAPPDMPRGMQPVVRAYRDAVVGEARLPIILLFATTTLLLLVACANVAGLFVVRGQGRAREFAIRTSLGASRARLVGPVIAEVAWVTLAAAVVGLAAATWALPTLLAFAPERLPLDGTIAIGGRVIVVTALLALISVGLGAVVPALAQLAEPATLLRHRGQTAPGLRWATHVAVVVQTAVAVLVIVGAGWLIRSVAALGEVEVGFPDNRLMFVRLAVPHELAASPEELRQRLEALTTRLEAMPGVSAATAVNTPPFSGFGWDVPQYMADGQDPQDAAANPPVALEAVHPQHFRAMGVPLVMGRAFLPDDTASTTLVAVVSRSIAARAWPDQDPIGRRLRMGGPASTERWRTVVGVVEDVRYRDVRHALPTLYVPSTQLVETAQSLVVRTDAGTPPASADIRELATSIDARIGVLDVTPFDVLRARPLRAHVFQTQVVTFFAAVILLLAAAGLNVVVAATVRRRMPEFGLRAAVGASTGSLWRSVAREGVALALAGSALGVVGALVLRRPLDAVLFGLPSVDPLTIAGAVIVVVVAAVCACALPARRAAAVDPASLLRAE